MMVDPYGKIDDLADLDESDWESLREWVSERDFCFKIGSFFFNLIMQKFI